MMTGEPVDFLAVEPDPSATAWQALADEIEHQNRELARGMNPHVTAGRPLSWGELYVLAWKGTRK